MKKKIALACALLLSGASLSAQKMTETVYLKNGSIIRGTIVEEVPGQSVKIQTKDGNVFVYQMGDIDRIAKELTASPASVGKYGHGHRGLDFSVEGGVALGRNGSVAGMGGVELGKRFNQNFYWGVGLGVLSGNGADAHMPITTTFKTLFPVTASGIAPNIAFRTGFVYNTGKDKTVGSGKYKTTIEAKHGWEIDLLPGVQIPLNQKVDFNVNLGYQCGITFGGGGAGHAFLLKAGFGFHKPFERRISAGKTKEKTKENKEKTPTRDRGLQYSIEATGGGGESTNFNFGFLLSYKWNPNISVGIGYQTNASMTTNDIFTYSETYDKTNVYKDDVTGAAHVLFLRGQYRLTDKKFSPFASVDIGFRKYIFDVVSDYYSNNNGYTYGNFFYEECPYLISSGFLFTPAIGASLRTTNNSYLEFKVGYNCTSGLKAVKDHQSYQITPTRTEENDLIIKKKGLGNFFFGIGFTHTLKWGAGIRDKVTDRYNKTKAKLSKKK
ncbi:MAG: hypothetical protein J1F06_05195 [Prevotellaceae bacterium]|nr:hypothetical protein [Prevotellaceae bacterium]